MYKSCLFVVILLACSCKSNYKKGSLLNNVHKPVVLLQPLSYSDSATLQFLKDSIQQFYPVNVEIATSKSFPSNAYYKPRNRYRADSTIAWLHATKPTQYKSVIAVTNSDVSVTKSGQADFGVMGLGYKPGDACVISTYRLKQTAKNAKHLQQRLFKVVVHEMGHNFSLGHCPDQQCIMVDAETKMKLDGVKDMCASCGKKLKM